MYKSSTVVIAGMAQEEQIEFANTFIAQGRIEAAFIAVETGQVETVTLSRPVEILSFVSEP